MNITNLFSFLLSPRTSGGGSGLPVDLPSMTSLFMPADGYTFTTNVGATPSVHNGVVGRWENRVVAANNNLTQSDNSFRPTLQVNGVHSYLKFLPGSGTDQSLTYDSNPLANASVSNAAYLIVRAKKLGGSGEFATWTTNSDDNNSYIDLSNTTYETFGTTSRKSFGNGGAFAASQGAILEVAATNTYWKAYINGALVSDVTGNTLPAWLTRPAIGAVNGAGGNPTLDGLIVAIATSTEIPSDAQRTAARNAFNVPVIA